MEECVGYVELVHGPIVGCYQSEDSLDGGWLDHRGERLSEVDAGALMKPPNDPTDLVSFESSVCVELVFKHPLAGDHSSAWWTRNKSPRSISL